MSIGDELLAQMIMRMHDMLAEIKEKLESMEGSMATAHEQLVELQTKVNDFRSDLFTRLDLLEAAQGNFNPEAQAIFDDIKATVAASDERVGDADGSDTPVPLEEEPTQ